MHELKVVDDDEPEVFQPPAPRLHLGNGDGRRIVQINRRVAQCLRGQSDTLPLVLVHLGVAQPLEVYSPLGGQHAERQLRPGHLKVENRHILPRAARGVQRDVQRDARLSNSGAGRKEDKVGVVQPGGVVVQLGKARGNAQHPLLFAGYL